MEEDDEVALRHRLEGAAGDLAEEDDRDPGGGGGDVAARHEAEVDRARRHDEAAEENARDRGPAEAVLERLRRLQQVAVLVQFLVDFGFCHGMVPQKASKHSVRPETGAISRLPTSKYRATNGPWRRRCGGRISCCQ